MSLKNKLIYSLVLMILGLMLAIHFQSSSEQEVRETRDMWEIRQQLQNEQNNQQLLQNELNELKIVQAQYESTSEQDQIQALNESISLLEEKAGLTDIVDSGVLIELIPNYNEQTEDLAFPELTPELLNRLINELNSYGANHIAINDERLTNLTAIRNIGDQTYMNQRPLPDLPLTIKIASDDPDRLLSYMEVSQSRDEFAMHNILFELEKTDNVKIPAYDGELNLQYVEVIEDDKAGGS
ncbi:DUF881 domain-containing protein [Amphibacillus sp. Q70]|uniref:DUF881 domain-containing protein n=1 Tax=Amphibacillus sp. Q70 TaxID=3453416 RepID=UPI003F876A39